MAAVLQAGLAGLGLEPDEDIVNYLVELLEAEGAEACAEWLESATTANQAEAARKLADDALTSLQASKENANHAHATSSTTGAEAAEDIADPLQGIDIAFATAKTTGSAAPNTTETAAARQMNLELDKDLRREIVQRYACVEVQTVHLDENGQVYSSGVSLRDLESDVVIPTNDNAARVRQEQHERRLSQKQQHLEVQEKQRQQKLKQQQREEKERLRCQKKERQK
ncbi:capsule biosynthesis protein, putative [Babesia caballi]|uniref:Capsule biosynthesis protein, putative n=1 Tax=Babesia caballi TaxID=5871 RepID=A0AAV4LTL8_BABCB|nr:capsule biosynthesis protein, putative [Babesia caballi]